MEPITEVVGSSHCWAGATTPKLSILVPTYDFDVVGLCRELVSDMQPLPAGQVELIVLIDGNPRLPDHMAIIEAANDRSVAACVVMAKRNLGRAVARNTLALWARGQFLQFLDADSLPDSPGFVGRALAEIGDKQVVLCGGRTGRRHTDAPANARLFERHSRLREWIPADVRNLDPLGCFLSANFIVAHDLFLAEPFDGNFCGWGWEDTEWAHRIGRIARVKHFENSVSHMEHHTDAVWLQRLERSAPNYARLCRLHPTAVLNHRIYPFIRMLRCDLELKSLKSLLRAVVLAPQIPSFIRISTLKILQAICYGFALNERR
jgi:glycosyltransferase involved in cell wall biosynthesis